MSRFKPYEIMPRYGPWSHGEAAADILNRETGMKIGSVSANEKGRWVVRIYGPAYTLVVVGKPRRFLSEAAGACWRAAQETATP